MLPRMWWSSSRAVVLAGLLSLIPNVFAIRMPIQRRDDPPHSTRLSFTNNADPFAFGVANTAGDGQTIYFVTINVDGQDYAVQLDTGSSDLWLDTTNTTLSSNVVNTQQSGSMLYGDGTVAVGDIVVGEVKFGDFVVNKQAFISAKGTNATSDGDQGLLGVGPPLLSTIKTTLANSSTDGSPLLQNIFSLYPNESNYMTFMLNRSIFGVTNGGVFTIGEVAPEYSSVTKMPQLTVLEGSNQWIVVMDSVIINGQNVTGHGMLDNTTESVPAQFQHKLVSLLDSGTSLATGPQFYVDAIYKNIPGASLADADAGLYKVPCDTKLNVSMIFNGTEYPMNPLDLTQVATDDDNVTIICASTIGYNAPDQGMDFILGDSFMRNTYALFDFGDMTNANDSSPFVQLLGITDKNTAWAQFDAANQARIQAYNVSVIGNQTSNTSSSNSGSGKGSLAAIDDPEDYNALMRNSWIIIGLLAGVLVLLVGVVVMQFMRGRQERKYQPLRNAGGPSYGKGSYDTPYDS